jgi:hypothetical protein
MCLKDTQTPQGHSLQTKESEKGFAGRINKEKRILVLKFSNFIIFSPPFEGGVAGPIHYLIFTRFISRPGWLIYSFFSYLYIYEKQKPLQQKRS